MIPKFLILDRDGVINVNSKDKERSYYYILKKENLILKEGSIEAFSMLKTIGVKVILATRQRCIEKRLVDLEVVEGVNTYVERLLNFTFYGKYIQASGENKEDIFSMIINQNGGDPGDFLLIDDSQHECAVATSLGIKSICSDDLLTSIKKVYAANS